MNALQILSEIDFQHKRALFANVPEHAVKRTRFSDRTANDLTRCILQWLTLHGHYAVRVTTTGRYLVHEKKWIPGTTRKGTADIHASINGKHVSIEIKIGRDRMSQAQERTKNDVQRAGGVYIVARSFDDFLEQYHSLTGPGSNTQMKKTNA